MIYSLRAVSPRSMNHIYIHKVSKSNRLSFHMGKVSELWHKAMVIMFSSIVLKSRPVLMSQKLRKQMSRQEFQK